MVKFFKRLLRLFSIKGNKALKKYEDSIEVYEYELQKSKENLDKLAESNSKLQASRQLSVDKRDKSQVYLDSLQKVLEQAAEQKDHALGEKVLGLIDANEQKVQMHQVAVDSYDHAISTLEAQYENLKAKLTEKHAQLDGLKAKSEFAKNMHVVNQELKEHYSEGDFNLTSFEAIEEELAGKIYYEKDRNAKLAAEPSVDDIVKAQSRKSRFEEYMEKREAKNTPQKALEAPKAVEVVQTN